MSSNHCTDDLTTLCNHGRSPEALRLALKGYRLGSAVSRDIVYSLLGAASIIKKDVRLVRDLHCLVVSAGFHWISSFGDHLVRLLSSLGGLLDASLIFCGITKPTVYSWNAIIEAHSVSSIEKNCIFLYYGMLQSGVEPDEVSFLALLKACVILGDVKQGALMHHEIVCSVFSLTVNTSNSILNMYAKFGCLAEARNIFSALPNRSVVSWGAMFSGYAQHSYGFETFQLYEEMEDEGVKPSKAAFLSVLDACGDLGNVKKGKLIHDKIIRSELGSDVGVGNALVDMYVKCRCLDEAYMIFKQLPFQDIMSWNAIMTGFSLDDEKFVLQLFEQMLENGLKITKGR